MFVNLILMQLEAGVRELVRVQAPQSAPLNYSNFMIILSMILQSLLIVQDGR